MPPSHGVHSPQSQDRVYTNYVHNESIITGATSARNVQVGNIINTRRSRQRDDSEDSAGRTYNSSVHNVSYITGTTSARHFQQGNIINQASGRSGRQDVFVGTRTSGRSVQRGIIVDTGIGETQDSRPEFSPLHSQDRVYSHYIHNQSNVNAPTTGRYAQVGNVFNTRSRRRYDDDDSDED
jgi:hypothetical protein